MDKKELKPCLSDLYKNEHIRNIIWDILGEDFEESFGKLMKEGKSIKSLLVKTAKLHKIEIKKIFIEFGFELETLNI